MELAQDKPVRKRRRWLIVALVLVFVSLGTWWYWPRGDARFVGTWNCMNATTGDAGHACVLHLEANGQGWSTEPDGSKPWISFPWSADGRAFTMGRSYRGFDWHAAWLYIKLMRWTGRTFMPAEARYQIMAMSPDRIEMVRDTPDEGIVRYTLVRLPE